MNIPMGVSRIGGPVVDLPVGTKYPRGYCFLAQLNLEVFSTYDRAGLLPVQGHLYFFVKENDDGGIEDRGIVIYSDCDAGELQRVIREDDAESPFAGRLIGRPKAETEYKALRYYMDEEGTRQWDPFAYSDVSKLFGIFTNVQLDEEDIEKMMKGRVLLLQIGSDFMEQGVMIVYINERDLARRDFNKCIFEYSQT